MGEQSGFDDDTSLVQMRLFEVELEDDVVEVVQLSQFLRFFWNICKMVG